MTLTRCLFAAIAAVGLMVLAAPLSAAERPNVILIMADDLGYETLGCNGGTSAPTPNLDKLAAGGVRFDHCFVQPLCTPTRVQLMTGAYNVRNYITFGTMDTRLRTFGNLFRDAGYATAVVGKWQLGKEPDNPKHFGFDDYCLWNHTRRVPRYANPGLDYAGQPRDFTSGEYGPDLVNDWAIDYVTRHRDTPFFLYYPMMLTHGPYQPTPDSPDWDPQASGEKVNNADKHFPEMVTYMDKLVGRLVDKLDELKLRERTLVLFVGDNGTGRGTRSMMGSREVIGGKGTTTEAGMHVPAIASWPGKAAVGKVCSDLVDSTDFLPTICEAAAVAVPSGMPIDGRSFLAQVRGETGQPREWIYSWYSPHGEPPREFAFDQRWKLYRSGEVYDLQADPREKSPLDRARLSAEAKEAVRNLEAAIAGFADARPADIASTASEAEESKLERPRKREKVERRARRAARGKAN
ncbi:MAG: sulfatase-like hydrolase/transferase [Pirellulales bacterium]|nr:sulfatase-like hydrolase/transferase [Pirellulales bacterium]